MCGVDDAYSAKVTEVFPVGGAADVSLDIIHPVSGDAIPHSLAFSCAILAADMSTVRVIDPERIANDSETDASLFPSEIIPGDISKVPAIWVVRPIAKDITEG